MRPRLSYLTELGTPGGDVPYHAPGPRLFTVHEVSVQLDPWERDRAPLFVTLTGPMMKADGTRARHQRCAGVDPSKPLPQWLADIVADATARLAVQP